MIKLTPVEYISFLVLAPLSVVAGLVLIALFAYYPYLRKPPGWLIIWQCIAQTVLDVHWFSFAEEHPRNPVCRTLGALGIYCYYLAFMYTGMISWVIVQCLRHPIEVEEYKQTGYLHHGLCHLGALALSIPIAASRDSGRSIMGTCFIYHRSWAEYVSRRVMLIIPLIVLTPLMLVAVWMSYRKYDKRYRKFILRHLAVVVVFSGCWLPVALVHFLNESHINGESPTLNYVRIPQIAALLGSGSGLLTVVARLLEPGLFKKLIHRQPIPLEIPIGQLSLDPDVE